MNKDNICAGIVLYNPDYDRLKKNIEGIYRQVRIVYCYDNGIENQIKSMLSDYPNVRIIGKGENNGIAKAINCIAAAATVENIKWLLTLDQDSVCPPNMMQEFGKYMNYKNVSIICPYVIDKRRPQEELVFDEKITEVDFCITSGALMNLDVFFEIGKMDEYLFIGLVDNEYSYKSIMNGYRIIRVNTVILDHELGNIVSSRFSRQFLKIGELFNNEKIKSLSYKRVVSPFRLYYSTRNIIYLSNKYKNSNVIEFSSKYAIKNGIYSIIRAHFSPRIIRAFVNGILDGKKNNN